MADAIPSRPQKTDKAIDPGGYELKPGEKIKKVDGRTVVSKKGANGNEVRFFLDGK